MKKSAELQKLNDALKKRIKELEKSEKQLKEMQVHQVQSEKLVAIGQLAAGVAHEINNPLSYVALNIEHVHDYIQGLAMATPEFKKVISKNDFDRIVKLVPALKMKGDFDSLMGEVQEGIGRIRNIVQSLKGFSRLDDAEKNAMSDINDGLKSTLVVVQNELKHCADVQVTYGDLPKVYCNLSEINQVFLNILVNAIAAIKEQKIDRGIIRIRTYHFEKSVVCEIENEGKQIPQRFRNKIFDPFFTTKKVGEGTGLGLSISYDLVVNRHNGSLELDKTYTDGVRFIIKVPLDGELK